MDFRVEEIGPCRKKVTVVVPVERVRKEFDDQYREINKALVLPGFRPGKTPRKILEARFKGKVADEVKAKIVEEAYEEAVKAKTVEPISRPSVDVGNVPVEPEKPFEFAFEVVVRPDFALPEWRGIEVRVPAIDVRDEHVTQAIERLRVHEGKLVPAADGVVALDDVVAANVAVTSGEEPLWSENDIYYRVGTGVIEGVVAEGLDAALVGGKAGTVAKVVGRAAPDDAREALRGKEFDLRVEVTDVKRFVPAVLDEAFLKARDYDDLEEMRKDVHKKLVRSQERARDRLAEERVLDVLLSKCEIPLPEAVVEAGVSRWLERRRIEAEAEGIAEEEITKEATASRDEVRQRVERDLRIHFVLEKVGDAEKIEVSRQEVEGAIEQIARDSGREAGEVAEEFREPSRLGELATTMRHQKTREAVRRAATIIEEAAPAPEAAPDPADAGDEGADEGKKAKKKKK